MSTKDHRNAPAKRVIDPLLKRQLDNLGSHRTAGSVGDPLPPPTLRDANQPKPAPAKKRPARRVKPAKASKLTALSLSLATTAGLSGWFAHVDASHSSTLASDPISTISPDTVAPIAVPLDTTAPATTAPTTTPTPTTTAPAKKATIADGSYRGGAADTRYGPVQVAVVYQNGAIVDVTPLNYPNSNRRDQAINEYAIPRLIQSTLSVQSAQVDTVSGATYTSNGYRASLQSAIDAAKQANGITA